MTRRKLIEWLTKAIGGACAAIITVPALRYLIHPLRGRRDSNRDYKRVARLDGLPVGVPREFPVRGAQQDAWTMHPEQTIGRVWIVRRSSDETPPDQARLDVFTTTCPHLGCAIQLDTATKRFVCPCHKAGFLTDGDRISERELGHKNPAPRSMDSLAWRIVQDDESQQWWIEVQFQRFRQGLTTSIPLG